MTSPHRALDLPEILDQILDIAGPKAQLTAWNVSTRWRNSAKPLIGSHANPFWHGNGSLVEYGQPLPSDGSAECDLDSDYMESLGQTLRWELDRRENSHDQKYIYFPARLTQRSDLPEEIHTGFDKLDATQHRALNQSWHGAYRPNPLPSRVSPSALYWLDFSQLRLNPYFESLFDNRVVRTRGACHIALMPGSQPGDRLIDDTKYPSSLLRFMDDMSLTQPRCKAIGIYHSQDVQFQADQRRGTGPLDRKSSLRLLTRIRNDSGVRVRQVVAALKEHMDTVLSTWTTRAENLLTEVNTRHCNEDIWQVPGLPRFTLLLDSEDMGNEGMDEEAEIARMRLASANDVPTNWLLHPETHYPVCKMLSGHITRHCYMFANGWREERQAEWMPIDLIVETIESKVRRPINWDT